MQNLRKLLSGSGTLLLGSIGRHGVRILCQIALARVLMPSDFGHVAIVVSFQNVLLSFAEFGVSAYLIQTRDLPPSKIDSAIILNFVIVLLTATGFYFSATLLSNWWRIDIEVLVRIAAFGVFIKGLYAVQRCLLLRELNYRQVASYELWGAASYAVTAIGLGFAYRTPTTLLWADVISGFLVLAIVGRRFRLRPRSWGTQSDFKELFQFGGRILAGRMVGSVTQDLDRFVMGFLLPAKWLGGYDLSQKICLFIPAGLTSTMDQAALPIYSRISDDREAINRSYLLSIGAAAWVILPLCLFSYLNAESLVLFLFGEGWLFSVPMFKALACAGAIQSLGGGLCKAVFLSIGRPEALIRCNLLALVITPICLFGGAKFGPYGLAWGCTLSQFLGRVAFQLVMTQLTGLSFRRYLGVLWKPTLVTLAIGIPITILQKSQPVFGWPPQLQIGVSALLIAASYATVSLVFFRDWIWETLLPNRSLWLKRVFQ